MTGFGAGNQTGEYAEVAKALGAESVKVEDPNGIAPALENAKRANDDGKVAMIEIITRQDTRFSWYNDLLTPNA